jgi:hydroxyacylglutathione hydrolase
MLQVIPFVLGPVATNAYLIADDITGEAAAIDPAWDGQVISAEAQQRGWRIGQIWVTHAHFDHFAGAGDLLKRITPPASIALHPADLSLWQVKGGAEWFGFQIPATPQPDILLHAGQILHVGQYEFEVRHTPGHSQGHVIFYCATEKLAFCGDTIFAGSIGRTDLPGGDQETLVESIRREIFSLPDDTRLLCGHEEETSVGKERTSNPYLR